MATVNKGWAFVSGSGDYSAGGSDKQIQFNDGGILEGTSDLTWDGSKVHTTNLSASSNISASAFYGDGANITNVTASAVSVADGPEMSVQFRYDSPIGKEISGSSNLMWITGSTDYLQVTGNVRVKGYMYVGSAGTAYIINNADENTSIGLGGSGVPGVDGMTFTCGGKKLLVLDENGTDRVILGAVPSDVVYSSGSFTASQGIRMIGNSVVEGTLDMCPSAVLNVSTINACSPLTISASSISVTGSTIFSGSVIFYGTGSISGSEATFTTLSASNIVGASPLTITATSVTVAAPLSCSHNISASEFYGDGSNLIGLSSDTVDTTTDISNATFYVPFVNQSTGQNGETLYIHDVLSLNPSSSVAKIAETAPSASGGNNTATLVISSSAGSQNAYYGADVGQITFPGAPGSADDALVIAGGWVNMGGGPMDAMMIQASSSPAAVMFITASKMLLIESDSLSFEGDAEFSSEATFNEGLIVNNEAATFNSEVVSAGNVRISGASDVGLSVNSTMVGGASITAVGHINVGPGSGNFDIILNSSGEISASGDLNIAGNANVHDLSASTAISASEYYIQNGNSIYFGTGNDTKITRNGTNLDFNAGNIILNAGTQVSASSNLSASAFYGDGANLTNLPGGGGGGGIFTELNPKFAATTSSVSIGTILAPQATLYVSSSHDDELLIVDTESRSVPILFATGSGRIGINTRIPTHELSVSGAVSASANISASAYYLGVGGRDIVGGQTGVFSLLAGNTPMHINADSGNSVVIQAKVDIDGNGVLSSSTNVSASAFYGDGANLTNLPAGNPAGLNTQIQFNDGGSAFGGDSGLVFNKTTDVLTVVGAVSASALHVTSATNQRLIELGDSTCFLYRPEYDEVHSLTMASTNGEIMLSASDGIVAVAGTVANENAFFLDSGTEFAMLDGDDNVVLTILNSGDLSASSNISASAFYGDGSNLSGLSSDTVDTTTDTSNATFYVPFVNQSTGQAGETLYIHDVLALNPSSSAVKIADISGADTAALVLSSSTGKANNAGGRDRGVVSFPGAPGTDSDAMALRAGYMNKGGGDTDIIALEAANVGAAIVVSASGHTFVKGGGMTFEGNTTLHGSLSISSSGDQTLFQIDSLSPAESTPIVFVTGAAGVGINTDSPNVSFDVRHTGTLNPINLSNDTGGGEVVYFGTASGPIVTGGLYYLNADGGWQSANAANTGSGHNQLMGIAMGNQPLTKGILIKGYFDVNTFYSGSFIKGAPMYIQSSSVARTDLEGGCLSGAAPAASDSYVRVLGYGTDTPNVIYFNPDATYVEIG